MKRKYITTILSYLPIEEIKKGKLINSKWFKIISLMNRYYSLTGNQWNKQTLEFKYLDCLTLVKNREPLISLPNCHISNFHFYALSLYGINELQCIVCPENIIHLEVYFIDSLGPIWLGQLKAFVNLTYLKIISFMYEMDCSNIPFIPHLKVFKTKSKGGNALVLMTSLKELECKDDINIQHCHELKTLTLHLDPSQLLERTYSFNSLKKLKSLKRLIIKDDLFKRSYSMFDLNQLVNYSKQIKIIFMLKHVVIPFNYTPWFDYSEMTFCLKNKSTFSLLNSLNVNVKNKHIFMDRLEISRCNELSINSLLNSIETKTIKFIDCTICFNKINFYPLQTLTSLWIKRMKSLDLLLLNEMKQLNSLRLEYIEETKNVKSLLESVYLKNLIIKNCRGIYLKTIVRMKHLLTLDYDQRDLPVKGPFKKLLNKLNLNHNNEFLKYYTYLRQLPNCKYNSVQINFIHPSLTDNYYYFNHNIE
ncbi:hypothetical protein ENU1_006320 [Entamoeba nuttalli P19]|uniref:Uncharacterized protein n=2 Tax=Entamoeba nuttalli TaxID=412467 RepID=K2I222_ENTNP|nr:hypothetical protein ENU1_006320 [Entamoeba nuttalli P19]EKE42890.1 hypothetical protein ENU1_006320 [Entamoeba nuttalli P19]|eukprot:XP_008854773.1 hypothetical protein ENU1_006320 [Entamoeba nuttalli P19]